MYPIRQIADGSESAFRTFFDQTYDRLYRTAMHYLHSADAAEEVVLDVYATLWERRRELPDVRDVDGYCFILTRNAALNTARSIDIERQHRATPTAATGDTLPSTDTADVPSPEDNMIADELFARYVRALDSLPDACRRVWTAVREQGLSYRQAAESLGLSPKTIDAQIQKATRLLRLQMQRD